jgi:hypothetical protein
MLRRKSITRLKAQGEQSACGFPRASRSDVLKLIAALLKTLIQRFAGLIPVLPING